MPLVHEYTYKPPINKINSGKDFIRVLDDIRRDLGEMDPDFKVKTYKEIYEVIKKGRVELHVNLECAGSKGKYGFHPKIDFIEALRILDEYSGNLDATLDVAD